MERLNIMKSIKKNLRMIFLIYAAAIVIIMVLTQQADAVSETSRNDHTLMRGVTESTVYVTDSTGINTVVNILRINSGANVSLKVSSANYYYKNSTKSGRKRKAKRWNSKKWGYALVSKQAAKYSKIKDKAGIVIAASNGDFYNKNKNGQTRGNLIMEGNKVRSSKSEPYFAVMKDGRYMIRSKSSSTENVVEAVSGDNFSVRHGKVVVGKGIRYTQQMIGVTAQNDVIIINVPSNVPGSVGVSIYDAAMLMRQQGCVDALILDGGGSGTFLTRRSKSLKLRNISIDGFPRNVSSALLVVKNKKSKNKSTSTDAAVSMVTKKTKLTKLADGKYHYIANGKPKKGFVSINGKPYLFDKNGKGMTRTVKLGKTKYYFKKGALVRTSKGKVSAAALGFCGSGKGGTKLLFIYQSDKKALNIGLNPMIRKNNGKMANWADITAVPWTTVKHRIKGVYVGNGVKNLGNNFMYISTNPFNDNAKGKRTKLKIVSLPSSLKVMGTGCFQNHANLRKIIVPKNVRKVNAKAFYHSGKLTVTFKGKKPPKFGKNAFKQSAYAKRIKLIVPGNDRWKSAINRNMSRTGFKGAVKYK